MDSLHTHLIPRHSTSQNNAPGFISDSAEDDWTEDALVEEEPERKPTIHVIPRLKPQVKKEPLTKTIEELPQHIWVLGPIGSETWKVIHALNELLWNTAVEVDIFKSIKRKFQRDLHEFDTNGLYEAERIVTSELAFSGESTITAIENDASFSPEALQLMRQSGVVISLEEGDPEKLAQRIILATKRGEPIPPNLLHLSKSELIKKFRAIHMVQDNMHRAAHVHVEIGTFPVNALVGAILKSKPVRLFLS